MGKTRDLFRKIRGTKGTFHAKMGSIKDRNGIDLTEAEDIKKRWQEYTEELYKKDLLCQHLGPNVLWLSPLPTALFWGANCVGNGQVLAKQRAEVRQSTQRFFSEQQQNKQIGGKAQKVDSDSSKPPETLTDPPGVCQEKVEEKPPPAPTIATKPIRTGPIKPQAIKTEETKS